VKREWNIRVGRKAKVIADFHAPMHKLDRKGVCDFLRALVIRHRTDTPQEMLDYYVNNRRGKPIHRKDADARFYFDYEKCLSGYWCGDWECYASAAFQLTSEEAEALHNIHLQNKRAQ
jgi:hypothetical protein